MKSDLHNHSMRSPDGGASYHLIVDAAHKNGVKYLAITDHDHIPTIEDMVEIDHYAKTKDMEVFLGVENTTEKGIHVQSFYPLRTKELKNSVDFGRYMNDRKAILTGIQEAGKIIQENYKNIGYGLTLEECKKYAGKASFQTLFYFTSLGEKYPELFGKGFQPNRKGAMELHEKTFDGKDPRTIRYLQVSCDLDKYGEEFVEKTRLFYDVSIPKRSELYNTNNLIKFLSKYDAVITLAHPGLILPDIFNENIEKWVDSGLTAISCNYPYDKIGYKKEWNMPIEQFNEKMKNLANKYNLLISGGTDSHQGPEEGVSFNGLFAGEHAFDCTDNKLIPKLFQAKKRYYNEFR